jgi:hypothetical protein
MKEYDVGAGKDLLREQVVDAWNALSVEEFKAFAKSVGAARISALTFDSGSLGGCESFTAGTEVLVALDDSGALEDIPASSLVENDTRLMLVRAAVLTLSGRSLVWALSLFNSIPAGLLLEVDHGWVVAGNERPVRATESSEVVVGMNPGFLAGLPGIIGLGLAAAAEPLALARLAISALGNFGSGELAVQRDLYLYFAIVDSLELDDEPSGDSQLGRAIRHLAVALSGLVVPRLLAERGEGYVELVGLLGSCRDVSLLASVLALLEFPRDQTFLEELQDTCEMAGTETLLKEARGERGEQPDLDALEE